MTFAKLLLSHRRRLGLSQEALGALLGYHRNTIYAFEAGTRKPRKPVEKAILMQLEAEKPKP